MAFLNKEETIQLFNEIKNNSILLNEHWNNPTLRVSYYGILKDLLNLVLRTVTLEYAYRIRVSMLIFGAMRKANPLCLNDNHLKSLTECFHILSTEENDIYFKDQVSTIDSILLENDLDWIMGYEDKQNILTNELDKYRTTEGIVWNLQAVIDNVKEKRLTN